MGVIFILAGGIIVVVGVSLFIGAVVENLRSSKRKRNADRWL